MKRRGPSRNVGETKPCPTAGNEAAGQRQKGQRGPTGGGRSRKGGAPLGAGMPGAPAQRTQKARAPQGTKGANNAQGDGKPPRTQDAGWTANAREGARDEVPARGPRQRESQSPRPLRRQRQASRRGGQTTPRPTPPPAQAAPGAERLRAGSPCTAARTVMEPHSQVLGPRSQATRVRQRKPRRPSKYGPNGRSGGVPPEPQRTSPPAPGRKTARGGRPPKEQLRTQGRDSVCSRGTLRAAWPPAADGRSAEAGKKRRGHRIAGRRGARGTGPEERRGTRAQGAQDRRTDLARAKRPPAAAGGVRARRRHGRRQTGPPGLGSSQKAPAAPEQRFTL